MTGVWPWLAVAGAGALHGLNPASGWAFMATRGRARDGRAGAWRALVPIAIGHAASVAAIVALAALGLVAQRGVLPWLAGGLAVLAAAVHVTSHLPRSLGAVAGQAGVALWSFTMGVAHGTGLMLVPALIPLCLSGSPAREITASGSLMLALAAVAVHLAALLGVAGAAAALARGGWDFYFHIARAVTPPTRWDPLEQHHQPASGGLSRGSFHVNSPISDLSSFQTIP